MAHDTARTVSDEPETLPLRGLRFSLVGAGRVGTSLARWAVRRGAEANLVCGRRSGRELARELAAEWVEPDRLASAGQDLLLIAVDDGALAPLARRLAARRQAKVALHTAGCLGSEVLAPLRAAGCDIGSLHPLRAFPRPLPESRGGFFAIDGDRGARHLARRLVDAWGGESHEITGPARALYHLGASLAAGGVVTVIAAACELAEQAGLPPAVLAGYLELARGALDQVELTGDAAAAITGPVARDDRETLARHADALAHAAPQLAPIVADLARETRRQQSRRRQRETGPAGTAHGGPARKPRNAGRNR